MISVDQILLNAAPDDLVIDSTELLPPSSSQLIPAAADLISKPNEQMNGVELSNDESNVNGFVFVNKN